MIKISFVIPALNEEKYIGGSIKTIQENVPSIISYEIIVVDNGSTDKTIEIARSYNSKIIVIEGVTISELRNIGAMNAHGDILIFIDADVILTKDWGKNISDALNEFEKYDNFITGSIYDIEDSDNWIQAHWFKPIVNKKKVNYINAGHLIIKAKHFNNIGGFDKSIETGEDSELCRRAQQSGLKIINNPKLRVIHKGYPKTLLGFYKRERWHGRGDYTNLKFFSASKPAMISILHLIVLLFLFITFILLRNINYVFLYFLVVTFICVFFAIRRVGALKPTIFFVGYLYYIYFFARGMSFIDIIKRKIYTKFSIS